MDKSKSEKLKEILNQTLSSEDIEKKLKEEIKSNSDKKEKEKKILEDSKKEEEKSNKIKEAFENIETSYEKAEHIQHKTLEENNPLEEDVVIPNVRDRKKETRNMNIVLYLVIIIAVLLLTIVVYLFMKKDSSESKEKIQMTVSEKTVEKKQLEKPTINDTEETKKEVLTVLKPIVEEKKEININTKEVNKVEKIEKVVEPKIQIKEIIKEKIITKEIKLNKENFKKYYNSAKYNSLKCYNFKAGDIFPDNSCRNDLKKFINANKNAIRFEVIPVIAQDDNKIFDKMKDNIKQMDKSFQDRVKEYMFRGLSRERVLETSWQIKDILGEDTILTPTNYYVKSKKNNKGIIVKAYH